VGKTIELAIVRHQLYYAPCVAHVDMLSMIGHATFLRKCTEHNTRNPENLLLFYPSMDSWTWESASPGRQRTVVQVRLADIMCPDRNGNMHQTQLPFLPRPRQIAPNGQELECHAWDRQEPEATNE
jgi:hypothetical protein